MVPRPLGSDARASIPWEEDSAKMPVLAPPVRTEAKV
jgi:hypothetical protein